jgi:Concanavalin A-like lectin/glucanases superfamily
MGITYNPRIVSSGLVLALDAGNIKSYPGSGTTWTDLSGNSNTGTLTNGPTYNSGNGGSIVFDGVDDFIDFTSDSNLLPTAGLTVSVWFNPNVTTARGLVGKTSTGSNGYIFYVGGRNSMYFRVNDIVAFSLTNSLSAGAWFNMVGTWTPSTSMTVYRNGTQSFTLTTSIPASITDPSSILEIGSPPPGSATYFDGRIPQVSIYNRALTATEISQNYNALRGRYGL